MDTSLRGRHSKLTRVAVGRDGKDGIRWYFTPLEKSVHPLQVGSRRLTHLLAPGLTSSSINSTSPALSDRAQSSSLSPRLPYRTSSSWPSSCTRALRGTTLRRFVSTWTVAGRGSPCCATSSSNTRTLVRPTNDCRGPSRMLLRRPRMSPLAMLGTATSMNLLRQWNRSRTGTKQPGRGGRVRPHLPRATTLGAERCCQAPLRTDGVSMHVP